MSNNPRKYPQADIKILYAKAAGRCSFEQCRRDVVLEASNSDKTKQIGKIAHIVAHSQDGPRANPNYPKEKLDTYENWILLCSTCHDTVDAQESKYTVEDLRNIKTSHESWVTEQLDESMSDVTFAELDIAAKAIASGVHSDNNDLSVIAPEEKIQKNNLGPESRSYISMGLSRSAEVTKFLSEMSQLDDQFPIRLKDGFKQKYLELKETLSGDALFMSMLEFAQKGQGDFKQKAASLALLSHLFHLCEVFEK